MLFHYRALTRYHSRLAYRQFGFGRAVCSSPLRTLVYLYTQIVKRISHASFSLSSVKANSPAPNHFEPLK